MVYYLRKEQKRTYQKQQREVLSYILYEESHHTLRFNQRLSLGLPLSKETTMIPYGVIHKSS
jgi:hypothetical protein